MKHQLITLTFMSLVILMLVSGVEAVGIANPILEGTYDTAGLAYDVALSGNYTYIADGSNGLVVVNISDPAAPIQVGHYNTSSISQGVAISGKYAYIANGDNGLIIIDISNPAAPALAGSYNTAGYADGVAISGSYAYVADWRNGLVVIDISNPEAPKLAGSYDTTVLALGVAVSGNYAYVADGNHLVIIDIRNPAAPALAGSYGTAGFAMDVTISSDYAYVSGSNDFVIVNISNPALPILEGSYDMGSWTSAKNVELVGNFAYVATAGSYSGGIKIIDISNRSKPTLVGSYGTVEDVYGVAISGKYAYIANGDNGLVILRIIGSSTGSTHNINAGTSYSTIQEAINEASYDDEIQVDSGTYSENVVINKKITLRGIDTGAGMPVVDASGGRNAIVISTDGVTLEGFKVTNTSYGSGIRVNSNRNNVTGNTVVNTGTGIYLNSQSSNNFISANTIIDNTQDGIYLGYQSNNNSIQANMVINNTGRGIILESQSSDNYIISNKASNNNIGISLGGSGRNTLKNNTLVDNNYNFRLYLNTWEDTDFNNDIDISNLVNGKPIYYLKGASEIVIDSSSNAGTIYCINCDNITIKDIELINNNDGIFFYKTNNSKIQNTRVENNLRGISLFSSSNISISGNLASNNSYGIFLSSSSNNILENNLAFENYGMSYGNSYGIYINGNNNTLKNNIASDNVFDDDYSTSGNDCYGIRVEGNNNKIIDNTASNNTEVSYGYSYGLSISGSNNTIGNNNVSNNGIGVKLGYFSNNNYITNNKASNNDIGLYLYDSSWNILKDNILTDNRYNFKTEGWSDTSLYNDIDISNLVNGKPIYYLLNASGITLDSSSNAGTIYCVNCDDITIKYLTLSNNNSNGIYFYNTNNSKIENINAENNGIGIILSLSNNNNIKNSNFNYNFDQYSGNGIKLSKSNNNVISGNIANNNSNYGIFLQYSINNTIYHNNLAQSLNAFDNKNNIWDSGIEGNYYSDYSGTDSNGDGIGDSSYPIPGGSNVDYFPLMVPYEFPTSGYEGKLIRQAGNIDVYLIEYDTKYNFTSPEALEWNGYSFDDVIEVSVDVINSFESGADISITQAIIDKYNALGDAATFGSPAGTGEQTGYPDNAGVICTYVNFQNGAIEYFTNGDQAGNAYAILNPFFDKWAYMGYAKSVLGYPISDMSDIQTSSFGTPFKYQNFINGTESGSLEYNLSSGEVFEIHGAIYATWSAMGHADSILGLVTSDERDAVPSFKGTTGRVSDFENGHLHWHSSGDHYMVTYMTYGDLDELYVSMGGTASWLGFPVMHQEDRGGYGYCEFEGGYIEWDVSEYKALPITGPVHNINKGTDYTTIQAAIDDASSGDEIHVDAGTYIENVIVDKQLALIGEGADMVIVQAADSKNHVIEVAADWVDISGFTVTGTQYCWDAGIYLNHSNYSYISDNNASNNGCGILIVCSFNNNLQRNICSDNWVGISLQSSSQNILKSFNASRNEYFGIHLERSPDNTIINNIAFSNVYGGISVGESSSENNLTENTANLNDGNGIYIWRSNNCILMNNNASSNGKIGIILEDANISTIANNIVENNYGGIYLNDSIDNLIYHNNIEYNTNQANDDTSANSWDFGYPLGGNYWSDYIGNDDNKGLNQDQLGSDGIGDTSHPIPGGSNVDRYPLMNPYTESPLSGKIAFASSRDGNQEVYVMNANGTGDPIDLTNRPDADDGDPTWSPDGKHIAFSSNRSGNWTTYIMNADGSDQVCILEDVYDAWGPAWSPDGTKIAVAVMNNLSDNFEIYTVDLQSKALTQVTYNNSTDSHPSWSPNSHKIVFTSDRDNNQEIYVADLLTGIKTRLTNNSSNDDYPEWSPDGSTIAFVSERHGNPEIYSMVIASKAITRLTYDGSIDKHAQWSPDGQKIVFVSNRSGDMNVYVMETDGTGVTCLLDWEGNETHPTWSPDHSYPPAYSVGEGAPTPEIEQLFIDAYNRNGGVDVLGNPTTEVHDAWGYLVQDFPGANGYAGGIIMYNPNENSAYYIHGKIWDRYYSLGGPIAQTDIEFQLGLPINDVLPYVHSEPPLISSHGSQYRYLNFAGETEMAALEYNLAADMVYEIHGAIYATWSAMGHADSILGLVTSDERDAVPSFKGTTGRVSDFENGHLHWHSSGDHYMVTYMTYGDLDELYVSMGGTDSWLGFPVMVQEDRGGYGYCEFEGGYIEWDAASGEYIVKSFGITDGLVAEWHFDEGSSNILTDSSGNGNDGTIYGATWTTDGKFGSALQFDGVNDFISIPTASILNPDDDSWTIEAWINIPTLPTSNYNYPVMAKHDGDMDNGYTICVNDGYVGYMVDHYNGPNYKVNSIISTNAWYHVAGVLDRTTNTLRIFVNGSQTGSTSISGLGTINPSNPLWIGRYNRESWSRYEYFNGTIDEIKIYNRVLSHDEIKAEYEKGGITPTTDITLISPNGGEDWQVGTTQTIQWSYTGDTGPGVEIEIFNSSGPVQTFTYVPIGSDGSGSYSWLIPENLASGTDYQVKITIIGSAYSDTSDGMFTISTSTASQDKSLIHVEGQFEIYWLQNDRLYWVTDWDVISQMSKVSGWDSVNTLPASEFNPEDYEQGPRFITTDTISDGLLICEHGHPEIYLISGSEKHHFTSPEALEWNGYSFDDVIDVSSAVIAMFPPGNDITITQAIIEKYNKPDVSTFLGAPEGKGEIEAGQSPHGTTGTYVEFANGHIHWISNNPYENIDNPNRGKAFFTYGDLDWKYTFLGGTNDWLGFPVMDEEKRDEYGHGYCEFEGGYIDWDANRGEHFVVYYDPYNQPDLIVTDISFSKDDPAEGEPITVTAKIKNIGPVDIQGDMWIYFWQVSYYNDFENDEKGSEAIIQRLRGPGLASGQEVETEITWNVASIYTTQGGIIKVEVDADEEIDEIDENNNNIFGKVTVTSLADFRPERDAYHFKNFEPSTDQKIDMTKNVKAWFDLSTNPFGLGIDIVSLFGGSLCYGMSSTDILYYDERLSKPVDKNVFDMLKTDKDVTSNILRYQAMQFPDLLFNLFIGLQPDYLVNVENEFNKIEDSIKNGEYVVSHIRFYYENGATMGSHAVLPIGTYSKDKIKNVIVIDPNNPGMSRVIQFDFENNKIIYNDFYKGLYEVHASYLSTTEPLLSISDGKNVLDVLSDMIYKSLFDIKSKLLMFKCPIDITIIDQYGRIIDNKGNNEIPDSKVQIIGDSKIFLLPADLDYSIRIDAYDSGDFTFTQINPITSEYASLISFLEVPITENTEAISEVSSTNPEYKIQIDYDGDGIIDEIIKPDIIDIVGVDFYNITFLPPITTMNQFNLTDGSTLPIKFTTRNITTNEFIYDPTVNITITNSTGHLITYFTNGTGTDSVRIYSEEEQYLANLNTVDFPELTIGETYAIQVTFGDVDGLRGYAIAHFTLINGTPPAAITNLHPTSGTTWINWTWTNPLDSDFNHTEIYLNGIFQTNTSAEFFNATSLIPNTEYKISTRTSDNLGNINETWVNDTAMTLDTPPVSNASGPYTGIEGQAIIFNASASYDPDPGDYITSFEWDFNNDGSTDATGIEATWTWNDDHTGQVNLTVTDSHGESSTDTTSVTILNAPPDVKAGNNQTVNEGDAVSFTGYFTDPGTDDTHTIEWNFGDGTPGSTGTIEPTHVYADNGTYTVTLTVTDDDGASTPDTLNVTVGNVAPIVDVGEDQTANEGDIVSFAGNFTDPGTADTHLIEWDFGDTTPISSGTLTPTHTYADNGIYAIDLTVTDDDGASTSDTLIVTVNNVAPVLDEDADQTVQWGDTMALSRNFTDSGDDSWTAEIDWGDGSQEEGILSGKTVTAAHEYSIPGEYICTLTVLDDDGGVGSGNMQITVTTRATQLEYIGDLSAQYSDYINLEAQLNDPGNNDPLPDRSINFILGTQTATATTGPDGIATTNFKLDQQAGSYDIKAEFAGDEFYSPDSDTEAMQISREDAEITYTGDTILPTTAGSIDLRATLEEIDTDYGDLTEINVNFTIYKSSDLSYSNPIATVPSVASISVTSSGMGVGTATETIDNLSEDDYMILAKIVPNDYYLPISSNPTPVIVYEPTEQFTTGGGWIWDPTGSHGNFGFNVKYNKKGKVQGNSIYVYRLDGFDYIVKSNAWIGLAISDNTSSFQGKAVLQIFDPVTGELQPESSGNFQFTVEAMDNELNGDPDYYEITVLDKEGLEYHNATGSLEGGNIVIHDKKSK